MSEIDKGINVPNKNDTISRQAALDALGERPMVWTDDDYVLGARNQYDMDRLAIETLPSSQPEPIRLRLDHELSKEEYERLKKDCAEQPIILLPKESAQPGEDIRAMCGECDAWNQYKNYPQPRWTTDVNDILAYLDGVVHPLVSPENWNVYSELYDMVSGLLKPWEGEPNE